ncbi:MAG: ribosomal RNA small subunit methyltransferase A [SAR324 cluster bacterium]|uniref:Ribosomal RNA small subunit methyltransferase A n=1 Tax=SAR324 cluster bacterium TaxID=2024889 RepID=A0A7X9FRP0_9DELT|nr:ribosomal RNA small subunit methyltransferase A [SAR324 cluster bacterium]
MTRVKDTLQRLQLKPKKAKGQNFIIDSSVIREILEFGHPSSEDALVEIGPGLGALTEELYKIMPPTLVEIEESFCRELQVKYPNSRIICGDVRFVDFSQIGKDLTVFGNLPYVYSTDIIFHLLSFAPILKRAVLLLQKEFVDRMAAAPGCKIYGSLSIACQIWADIFPGPIIDGASFHPPTKVSSRIVELRFLKETRYEISDLRWFRTVLKAAFSTRRKKLLNSLGSLIKCDKDTLKCLIKNSGIDPNCRAETLSVEEFVNLSNALKEALLEEQKSL